MTGTLTGLPEGRHGFHVHEFGNTSDNCMAAGSHINPDNVRIHCMSYFGKNGSRACTVNIFGSKSGH